VSPYMNMNMYMNIFVVDNMILFKRCCGSRTAKITQKFLPRCKNRYFHEWFSWKAWLGNKLKTIKIMPEI
jgi:hypothetical protein